MSESPAPVLTLAVLNSASLTECAALLEGIYEHSSWIARLSAASRPFTSLDHLKLVMVAAVREAQPAAQFALIEAHPQLAGRAMLANSLTAESSAEQSAAGLTHCSADELEALQTLNEAYRERFGFPFLLAVRGPRGAGLSRTEIINTFRRRLNNHPEAERCEALRNIHRIAELRLNERFGFEPVLGNQAWDWAQELGRISEPAFAEQGQLTVTYLTDAHRDCREQLKIWMQQAGFDEVSVDAVGNVIGLYYGAKPDAKRLLTGSHFDTVRNGGKYDGRLGIFVPMICVSQLSLAQCRLPFAIEVIGFAEEEGQRYSATFLGSGALTGQFDFAWLDQTDSAGVTMRAAMHQSGLNPDDIAGIKRNPNNYLGFVEVHIEQGPVLSSADLPLGVVTSINGSVRYQLEVIGQACHAGTTPMGARSDAALVVAELALYAEQCALNAPQVVATMGMFEVPNGSVNVVPGCCRFSLDVRAPTDEARDACEQDILAKLAEICQRRGTTVTRELLVRASAAPCADDWVQRWTDAVQTLGLPDFRMPSGAGHDAMKIHEIMPQAMLFVRGLNDGISHNPLESITSDDADLAVRAFTQLVHRLAQS